MLSHSKVRRAFEKQMQALQTYATSSKISTDNLKALKSKLLERFTHQNNASMYSATTPVIHVHRSSSFLDTWRDLYMMDLLFGRRQNVTNVYVNTSQNTRKNSQDDTQNKNVLVALVAIGALIFLASMDYVILKYLSSKFFKKIADPFRKPADFFKLASFGVGAYLGYIGGATATVYYLGAFFSPAILGVAGGVTGGILAGALLYGFTKQVLRLTNYLVHGATNTAANLPKAAMLNAPALQHLSEEQVGKTLADIFFTLKNSNNENFPNKEIAAVIRNPEYAPMVADFFTSTENNAAQEKNNLPSYGSLYPDLNPPPYNPAYTQ